jgi:ribosome biogenesis protein ERB1
MGSTKTNLKRKASTVDVNATTAAAEQAHSDDNDSDFGDGLLEGILDGDESEDDSDYVDDEANDNENDGSDVEDDIESDDIPTDGEQESKTAVMNGASQDKDLNIDDDEDNRPNYRIETDANGGMRYVYDEIDPIYDSDDSDVQGPVNTVRITASPCSSIPPSQPARTCNKNIVWAYIDYTAQKNLLNKACLLTLHL